MYYSAYDLKDRIYLLTGRNAKTKEDCIRQVGNLLMLVLSLRELHWELKIKKHKTKIGEIK